MQKIFTSSNIALIGFYKSILEDNQIKVIVKNYYLTGGIGDLPANECVPEIWVINDDQAKAAKLLLKSEASTTWRCECGEKIGPEFAQCWKCGKIRR